MTASSGDLLAELAVFRGRFRGVEESIPPPPDTDPRPAFTGSHAPPGDPIPTLETVDAKLNRVITLVELSRGENETTRKTAEGLVPVYKNLSDMVLRLERRVNPISFGARAAMVIGGAFVGGAGATFLMRIFGVAVIAVAIASCAGSG